MRFLAWIFSAAALAGGIVFPVVLAVRGGQFLSVPRQVLFGWFPVCVAAAALVAILKDNVARQMFLAYGLALVVALYGVEILLSVQSAFPARAAVVADKPILPVETRAYPQLCAYDLHLRNPPVRLGGKPVQPLSGLSNNLLNPTADHAAWRFTDRYGFNNPPDQWEEGSLMVVGDSYTFGVDVPIGQGFVDRLRDRVGRVVNLGCEGNGPLMELASLVEYGPLVRPNVVVWAYYEGNDLQRDLYEELSSPILPRYLSAGFKQDLAANQGQLDRSIADYLDEWLRGASARHHTTVSLRDIFWKRNLTLSNLRNSLGLVHQLDPRMVMLFKQILQRAMAVVAEWGGHIVFVYLPDKARYVSALGKWDATPYGQEVIDLVRGLGLDVIDIDAVFRKQPDPAALNERHYTVQGNALVGDAIADAMAHLR
jgi:hypothetical protein